MIPNKIKKIPRKLRTFWNERRYSYLGEEGISPAPEASSVELQLECGKCASLLENAYAWPKYGVAGGEGSIYAQTLTHPNRRKSIGRSKLCRRYPVLRVPGTAVSIGATWQNYFHRNVDMLPKLWLLHDPKVQQLGPLKLLLPEDYPAQERQLVLRLAPSNVEIVEVPVFKRVLVDRYLHLPQLSNTEDKDKDLSAAGWLPREYFEFFRRRVFNAWGLSHERAHADGPRVFVSRKLAAIRRLTNESQVSRRLAKHGFQVVQLEHLPLREQASLFNQASMIVGQHGAGLTNLIYARPGCRVVEVVCRGSWPPTYRTLEEPLSLDYRLFESVPQENSKRTLKDADSWLDCGELLELA